MDHLGNLTLRRFGVALHVAQDGSIKGIKLISGDFAFLGHQVRHCCIFCCNQERIARRDDDIFRLRG